MFDNLTDAERQNNSRTDFTYTEGRKERFSSQQKYDDQRHLADYDGKQESPRHRIQYHEKRPHSLGAFLLAFVLLFVVVFLSCPAIMAVVGWLFRL